MNAINAISPQDSLKWAFLGQLSSATGRNLVVKLSLVVLADLSRLGVKNAHKSGIKDLIAIGIEHNLVDAYMLGIIVSLTGLFNTSVDFVKSINLSERLLASPDGEDYYDTANSILSYLYTLGLGCPCNEVKAKEYLSRIEDVNNILFHFVENS